MVFLRKNVLNNALMSKYKQRLVTKFRIFWLRIKAVIKLQVLKKKLLVKFADFRFYLDLTTITAPRLQANRWDYRLHTSTNATTTHCSFSVIVVVKYAGTEKLRVSSTVNYTKTCLFAMKSRSAIEKNQI